MRRLLFLVILAALGFLNWNPPPREAQEAVLHFHTFLNHEDLAAFRQVTERFRRRYGIQVELTNFSIDMFKERFAYLAHRQPPDLILVPNDWLGSFAAAGRLTLLPEWLLDETRVLDACRDAGRLDGKLYGLPLFVETPLLIRNPELAPEPPAEFSALIRQLEAGRGATVPVLLYDVHSPYILSWFIHQCGGVLALDRPVNTREVSAGILWAAELARSIPAMADLRMDYAQMINCFQRGEAAMLVDGPWSFPALRASGVPFRVHPLPRTVGRPGPFFSLRCLAIPRGARRKDEALSLIRHLLSKESVLHFVREAGLAPARLLPAAEQPTEIRALLDSLSGSVLLPPNEGMTRFWRELTVLVEKLLVSGERRESRENTPAQ